MSTTLNLSRAFDWPGSMPPARSTTVVLDTLDTDGSFIVHHLISSLLKQQLQPSSVTNNVDGQADSKVVLVSTTHLLRHYMHVSRKLGVNLAIAKSRGKFMFVDAFTQLSPLSSLRSKFVQLSTSSSTDPTLPNAYIQSYEAFAKEQLDQTNTEDGHMRYVKHIYEQISSLAGTGSATIVLQDLSTLLDAGIPLHALNALVSALRSFAYRTESRLVLLAHADSDVMQDVSLPFDYAQYNPDSSLGSTHSSLVRTLLSVSQYVYHTKPLSSGFSRDVTGTLQLIRGGQCLDPAFTPAVWHYTLNESSFTITPLGFSSAVL